MDAKHAVQPGPAEVQPADPDAIGSAAPRPPAPIHQPARGLVALVEIVLAVALCLAAAWAWRSASIPYELPTSENPAVPRTVDRWSGPWVAAAFGLATLAGGLMIDAARQLMLAIRVSQRRPSRPESAGGGRPETVGEPWQTATHGRDSPHSDVE
jgi:hypothetical protein